MHLFLIVCLNCYSAIRLLSCKCEINLSSVQFSSWAAYDVYSASIAREQYQLDRHLEKRSTRHVQSGEIQLSLGIRGQRWI